MAIGQHPLLANPTHVSHLPASWGTLYELSRLPDDVGKMLADAKAEVGHGGWQYMFSEANPERLPFDDSSARRLMAVASHPLLSKRAHAHDLPSSWMTLYELSRLPDDVLEPALAEGSIRPDMERKHVKQLMPVQRAQSSEPDYEVGTEYCTSSQRPFLPPRAAFIVKAWNAYREGRDVGFLKWRTEQSPNEQFPRIK